MMMRSKFQFDFRQTKNAVLVTVFLFLGSGCVLPREIKIDSSMEPVISVQQNESTEMLNDSQMIEAIEYPIAAYEERLTVKKFGQYVQDRFTGYHVGDDIEYTDTLNKEVPVYAIADGEMRLAKFVNGYGGLVIIQHNIDGRSIMALYGHVDPSSINFSVGDIVKRGDIIANLGDHESLETDGERKHLHFSLYEGTEIRLQGYEQNVKAVRNWINPSEFLTNK